MRIVIDMQGAQTESRFRGIGRYTLAFAQAVARNRGEHDIILALSGLFPDTIEPIRSAFDDLLPQENIRVWHAPGPVKEEQPGNDARREMAELIREAFLAGLQPDVIHITNIFEGYEDDAVTSIGRFDTATPVSVTQYDLIPLLNPEHYLKPNPGYEQHYLRKVEYLKKAALHLAISEFSSQEGINALGTPNGKTIAISAAQDCHFQPRTINDKTANQLRNKFGIIRPFVLYTGGSDERKNLPRLIEAYAALPVRLRKAHQLLFAGKIPEGNIPRLKDIARSAGLRSDELLFIGYVSDEELIQLYNLCQLYVFPSWHEGFGLPALEAMACGAPVIGANASSLPEVIGWEGALFDPFDVEAIIAKLTQALEDEGFRNRLREHSLNQAKKFSWDETAKRAIVAMENLHATRPIAPAVRTGDRPRPRLAYVSPLPPERTGIADYSAELLPELARHYEIEVIVTQEAIDDPWIKDNCPVRSAQWFVEHADQYDRVLYHFGNSAFHQHMFDLLKAIPGVVVLHDFFLSGVVAHMDVNGFAPGRWAEELYFSHGHKALYDRFHNDDMADVAWEYPCSLSVIQNSLGLIVHSPNTLRLARQWYGGEADDWAVIPLMRDSRIHTDRAEPRKALGLGADDFLVCTFGMLGPTKLNHRLLEAWLESALARDGSCHLVFVGENHGGDYGQELLNGIRKGKAKGNIRITGWADREVFQQYLAAADAAVQLRALSRGETSAAALDCMNYGLPTIVNANGSMADLNEDAVWKLPDEFSDSELVDALEKLWRSPEQRRQLGKLARERILRHHAPDACARQYAEAIETIYSSTANGLPGLIQSLAEKPDLALSEAEMVQSAEALALNHPLPTRTKRLYLDVTATCRNDLKTGIERVARALTLALLESPPAGFRVEPIYLNQENGRWLYRHARRYTLGLLGCPKEGLDDDVIEPEAGDVLLGLDLSGDMLLQAEKSGLFKGLRNRGIEVWATVFDLLPVRLPEVFPPGADEGHHKWLSTISSFDGAVCISKAVADDLRAWRNERSIKELHRRPFSIGWFHLGADVGNSVPSTGTPPEAEGVLKNLRSRPTFLMVGTIEPRKGYLQVLDAFEQLWSEGVEVNLAIVGQEGWKNGVPDHMRRNIPLTVDRLRSNQQRDKRLFWLDGISDEYLEKVYAAGACLIAASYGEGFGLPLIEAAQHKLPIIARDIPVFREVAGDHAYYFDGEDSDELAIAIRNWLALYEKGKHHTSDKMPWLTWKDSAVQLLNLLIGDSELNATLNAQMGSKTERNLVHDT